MRAKPAIAIIVAAAAVIAGALNLPKASQHAKKPALFAPAPTFSAKTASGKAYDLATITKNGPVYLYFIKKDCPINAVAVTFYNKIYSAYGDKAPILGILNGSPDEYK